MRSFFYNCADFLCFVQIRFLFSCLMKFLPKNFFSQLIMKMKCLISALLFQPIKTLYQVVNGVYYPVVVVLCVLYLCAILLHFATVKLQACRLFSERNFSKQTLLLHTATTSRFKGGEFSQQQLDKMLKVVTIKVA